ncbi:PH domain-containing protein [Streptomyces flavalbus]|uniref:PH domain-containing protein n=1 Tax=Streptomyces flavalbus TaxID=2665155 RepID=A0ABW2WEW8_9ACTN
MDDVREVSCRPRYRRALWAWFGVAVVATVAGGAAGLVLGGPALLGVGVVPAVGAVAALRGATVRMAADGRGVRVWGPGRRRRAVAWSEVVEVGVRLRVVHSSGGTGEYRRVVLGLRSGRKWALPLPRGWESVDPAFTADLAALRALHRRYGRRESGRGGQSEQAPVVTSYTGAGRGWVGAVLLSLLFLGAAGLFASWMPDVTANERAWRAAVPCTAETPAAERQECLRGMSAVIERTEPHRPKKDSWLYFVDGRPLSRLRVSWEAAEAFQPGDRVRLTVWREQVMKVSGERYVWHEHVVTSRSTTVVIALLVLTAGYPAAVALTRLRGRRLPADAALPSTLPFAAALAATAVWLLPLCYRHPTSPPTSPGALAWAAGGAVVTVVLLVWAWRVTRAARARGVQLRPLA